MSDKSQRPLYSLFSVCWLLVWTQTPNDPVLMVLLLAAGGLLVGLMARSYIKGDPELEAQRKRELSQQRTKELEAELGIEPLDFSDLPDEAIHELKKEL